MFFMLSKMLAVFIAPVNCLCAWLVAGFFIRSWLKPACVFIVFFAFVPVGEWLLRPLEHRYAANPVISGPVDGIIVLGGAINAQRSRETGLLALNNNSDRLFHALALARRFPDAKIIHTGGSGSLFNQDDREAGWARSYFEAGGLDTKRLMIEGRSRNTAEHAAFLKDDKMIDPAGKTYILVTSAFHMPRAVGVFTKAGFDVIPYPVDVITQKKVQLSPEIDALNGLTNLTRAVREHTGLLAYRLTGRME